MELEHIEAGHAPQTPLFVAGRGHRQHALPIQLFRDLLDAFAQDVVKKRYADYPELLDYCRRSANPVGRLVLHLFGRTEPEHLAAIRLHLLGAAIDQLSGRMLRSTGKKSEFTSRKPIAAFQGQRGRHRRQPLVGQLGGADGF
jgi:hypothetical protein